MRKVLGFGVLLIILIVGLWSLLKNKTGDIRPSILPPQHKEKVAGEKVDYLKAPEGFQIEIYAKDIGQARDLEFSPKGTLLVSTPVQGKVLALYEENGRVVSKDVLNGLTYPHGIAFYKDKLYVAAETKVLRYNYDEENHTATLDKELFSLPVGGNHVSRSLDFKENGDMIVSMGSRCNVCFENDPFIAATIISNAEGKTPRLFATGLRNAVFVKVHPETQKIWVTEMGRDFLGDNLPPDEINILEDGKNYGWPICYGKKVYDKEFGQRKPEDCEKTIASTFDLPAHNAPLGLNFIDSKQFPKDWQGDLLVSLHGSWNRSVPDGYKVVHLKIDGNNVVSSEDFITGFISGSQAIARPVDIEFDKEGNLFLSDDKAGVVYKVSKL